MAFIGKLQKTFATFGPGLMYAGAAVGVSHLVQSTRAGANYGYDLLLVVLLANIIKYPFFEIAPRYVAATGNNLIDGYRTLGRYAVILFAVLTILTMFPILAAVGLVTSGIVQQLIGISGYPNTVNTIMLLMVMGVIWLGQYKSIDKIIKWTIVLLALTTIIAVVYSGLKRPLPETLNHFDWLSRVDIFFLIALAGWMPAPIDVAVWSSMWTQAKWKDNRSSGIKKIILRDFRTGYWGTMLLAVCFLLLGAFVMHNTNETFSANGSAFAGQLMHLYTSSLGKWTYPIVAIAALATMMSTTITVMDAYPRVLRPLTVMVFPTIGNKDEKFKLIYRYWLIVLVAGTIFLVNFLSQTMRFMVDLATTISFVTAPVLAYLNYRVVVQPHLASKIRLPLWMKIFAITGIIVLSIFSIAFIFWRFIN